ncbi:hypothetical protein ACFE04_013273 [Oxalis oulophora]
MVLVSKHEDTRRDRKRQKLVTPIIEIVDLDHDEHHNKGTNEKNPISVEHYNECTELKLAKTASLTRKYSNFIDLSDDDVILLDNKPKRKKPFSDYPVTEIGQSSNSKLDGIIDDDSIDISFMCEICAEFKSVTQSFDIKGCNHSYCKECVSKYVASKLEESITNIRCPVTDCTGLLDPEHCRGILSQDLFNRWGHALCEGMILESQKFYCPFKDCSVLLINEGGNVVMESECPYCWRLFCARCKVPWHGGIECADFQKLNKDERQSEDIMLMKLAEEKKWKRCPACKFYVEKSSGCMFMRCRCRVAFCYYCGADFTSHNFSECLKAQYPNEIPALPLNMGIRRRRARTD